MLSDKLTELRKAKKKTQQEMADYLGITRPAYTAYESGNRRPDYSTLKKLADYFEVSTDVLIGRITEQHLKNPDLTPKEERDLAGDLERMLNDLESNDSMAFSNESDDEETKELLKLSLEQSMRLAKKLAKKKFTPKKYKR